MRPVARTLVSEPAFFGVAALLFAVSAAITVAWCGSMTGGMSMPGGWIMSMAWMRMPGQSWPGATPSFLGMWSVMMVAMMLPSLLPMLWRYRRAVGGRAARHLGGLTTLVAAGYFLVWTLSGLAIFAAGVALAAIEMRVPALSRGVPVTCGVVVRLWVATYGDVPVGFAQVKMLDDEHPHLDEIDVHPAHGRRGAGTQLVKAVCAWAREAGYRTFTLGTFRDVPFNRPLYARLGFDVVAPHEYDPGMRAIVKDEAARGLDTTRRVIMRFLTTLAA